MNIHQLISEFQITMFNFKTIFVKFSRNVNIPRTLAVHLSF
jgi:hypothetical protein